MSGPVKGSALDIPAELLTGRQYFLPRNLIRFSAAGATLLFTLALAPSTYGQGSTAGDARTGLSSGASPSLLKGGPFGEMLALYTPRSRDEIQRLLDSARATQQSADNDIVESRQLTDLAEGRVRIMNEEVRTTKTRIGVAKKANNRTDRTALEAELKRQQAELDYFERLRDALRADAQWLNSQSRATAARVRALDLESDVAQKYGAINDSADSAVDIAGYRQALTQMFNAQQEAADRLKDAASKQKDRTTRRLKQLDALSKLKS